MSRESADGHGVFSQLKVGNDGHDVNSAQPGS